MSDESMVERLSEKSCREFGEDLSDDEIPSLSHECNEARWWLNAIADEVRGEAELRKTPGNFAGHFCTVSEWLRAQANEGVDDG